MGQTKAQKAAADKKAADIAAKKGVGASVGGPGPDDQGNKHPDPVQADAPVYSKADKKKIKQLEEEGVTLTGGESTAELDTLIAALPGDEDTDEGAVEEPGVPNKLPIRTEAIVLANKQYNIGIFYMAAVSNGRQAMYNYEGKRVSPAHGPSDILPGSEESSSPTKALNYYIKACAKFNAQRRRAMLPGDPELGAGSPLPR